MFDMTWILIISVIAIVGYVIGYRWWRQRKAGKLADRLLADVVKGKDSFRR